MMEIREETKENIEKINFKGTWRSYQKRVLNELEKHLNDSKLNVVAAPGAGKTTLGIEVLKRLNNPAFILAPTITIKNQWKQRIIDNFLQENCDTTWISTDIRNISTITITTYQALHTLYKTKKDIEKLVADLKSFNIKTIILDEAHHLRVEWWATLSGLVKTLENEDLKIVSLTGTPPYDVSPREWQNYHNLCGPTDAEISIPELVKTGDLCPHQDLIYFSNLTNEENNIIFDFDEKRREFFEYINTNFDFYSNVLTSPFVCDIEKNMELIYKNTTFSVSLISYLLFCDELSMEARLLLEFLDLDIKQIPKFDYNVAQTFFNSIFSDFEKVFKGSALIKNKLKELNLINGNKVDFSGKTDFKKLFARSKNKLEAIYNISKFEHEVLQNELREVVLLDYIGKGDSEGLNILSVFDKLYDLDIKLGVLTGTLIVIPKNAKERLYEFLKKENIDSSKVLTADFKDNYLRVEAYGNIDIVGIITRLFEFGEMNILIGTAALLGEGWDSPSVNTLIIASVVGSFMLSNQMRGRALRTNKNNPNKTSNIWHLVSLDKNFLSNQDYLTIEKRFNTFEGISYCDNKIRNGIDRLDLNYGLIEKLDCAKLNRKIFEYALDRRNLKTKWQQIFKKSAITEDIMVSQVYNVIEGEDTQIDITINEIPEYLSFLKHIIHENSIYTKEIKDRRFNKFILKMLSNCNVIGKDWEYVVDKNYYKFIQQENLKNLAEALLKTLCAIGKIKTPYKEMKLKFNSETNSKFYITLFGSTNYERNLFINAYEQIFKIDDSYRYVLKNPNGYIGVPEIIGDKSKQVEKFVKNLEQKFGFLDKIYTRIPDGYKELLKAKYNIMKISQIKNSRVWI